MTTRRALIRVMPISLVFPGAVRAQTPRAGSDDGGPLAPVVKAAFRTGFGRPLSGTLCTALGLTTKGQGLPVEQLSAKAGDVARSFSVSRHRGRLDIVISRRSVSDLVVFLLSSEGALVKAIRITEETPVENVSAAAAAPDLEQEKAYWLDTWLKQHRKLE